MKFITVIITVLLSLIILMKPEYASAAEMYRGKGSTASASFFQTDSSGCIFTAVDVGSLVDVQHYEAPGGPATTLVSFINITKTNQCTSTYSAMFGIVFNAEFQINQALSKAHLIAEIPACDSLGVCVNLAIDVAWTGTGEPSRIRNIQHMWVPFASLVSQYSGLSCDAQAIGTVFDGTTNLIPNPSSYGFMGTEQSFLLERN